MKRTPQKPSIYKITCTANNMVYIGQSEKPKNRIKSHWGALRLGHHHVNKMQLDFYFFGAKSFVPEIIEETKSSELSCCELKWILFYFLKDKSLLYNRTIQLPEHEDVLLHEHLFTYGRDGMNALQRDAHLKHPFLPDLIQGKSVGGKIDDKDWDIK
jgi:hypothetical protein